MGIKNDVFGLEQVYRLQVQGDWSAKSDIWLDPGSFTVNHPNTGYFGAGAPGAQSVVERIDYSNDTATALRKGHLAVERSDHAGFAPAGNANPQ